MQKSNKLRNQNKVIVLFYAFYSACRVICYLIDWLFLLHFLLILRNSMSLLSLKAPSFLHFVTVNWLRTRIPT